MACSNLALKLQFCRLRLQFVQITITITIREITITDYRLQITIREITILSIEITIRPIDIAVGPLVSPQDVCFWRSTSSSNGCAAQSYVAPSSTADSSSIAIFTFTPCSATLRCHAVTSGLGGDM